MSFKLSFKDILNEVPSLIFCEGYEKYISDIFWVFFFFLVNRLKLKLSISELLAKSLALHLFSEKVNKQTHSLNYFYQIKTQQ